MKAAPVIVGLAIGIGFIAIFSLPSVQFQQSPRTEFLMTDSGLAVLDTSYMEDSDRNQLVIGTMLRNSSVVELLEGRNVVIGSIGISKCNLGPVRL